MLPILETLSENCTNIYLREILRVFYILMSYF